MNPIRIKILLKNRCEQWDPDFHLKKPCSVLTDISWCGGDYTIQYSLYNNISVLVKKFNIDTENIFKIISSHDGI